jgi:hypothetical protein
MQNKTDNILLPASLFLITVISRIPFTSKYLYHMDSVQYALALEQYDITVHQPHPPGYFLYVMLGRLLNLFVQDANSTFIVISIFFSGLTVVAVFYLGKEIFSKKAGIIASAIAMTSPNLWFHGEIALTNVVEAFFSTLVAFLCWRIYKGKHHYIWLSVVALAVAGGIRQNTMIFLFPLWLFSVKGVPIRKTVSSLGLLVFCCLLWFVPMVYMTGGWNAYREAFRELWLFNTGNVSVFEKGWDTFRIFSSCLARFTVYGVGGGIFVLILAAYSLIRKKRIKSLDKTKVAFFSLWILPSFLFFLLIFIHPSNPGYVLVFMPALFILTALSVDFISADFKEIIKRDISTFIVFVIIAINLFMFFSSSYLTSYREIKTHDRNLSVMLDGIKKYDPSKAAIFILPYSFYGYRHIMYYLPHYRVYQVDVRVAPTGEVRKTFWGEKKKTFLSETIILPESFDTFIMPLIAEDKNKAEGIKGVDVEQLKPVNISIASGDISHLVDIYPELKMQLKHVGYRQND